MVRPSTERDETCGEDPAWRPGRHDSPSRSPVELATYGADASSRAEVIATVAGRRPVFDSLGLPEPRVGR
jgi:hypothetical protein